MTILKPLLLAASLLLGAGAHAACSYPSAPKDLPTGDSESKEQMITAQKAVKSYVAAMEAYLTCIDEEVLKLGDGASEEHLLMRDKRHNAAVDQMDSVASRFNQAVRAYKARQN